MPIVKLSAPLLDRGLNTLNSEANKILICGTEPTTYAEANSFKLGEKAFGVGGCSSDPVDHANGRAISSAANTDGSVTATGIPVCWAVIDDANTRLLATGGLSGAVAVAIGQVFTLASFTIDMAGSAEIVSIPLLGANLAAPSPFSTTPVFNSIAFSAASLSLSSPVLASPILNGTIADLTSSAGVYDSSGKLVRTLWSAVRNHPNVGDPSAAWDGQLEDGSIAPTATYTVKRLTHNVGYAWDGVVGNTSPNHINNLTYHNEGAVVSSMAIADNGEMYYTSQYHENWQVLHVTTPGNIQEMNQLTGGFNTQNRCCTDSNKVWFSLLSTQPSKSFVHALDCTTKTMVTFQYGTTTPESGSIPPQGLYYSALGLVENFPGDPFITGLAVQKTGNFLFFSRAGTILTLNKITGQTVQSNSSFAGPTWLATSPTTGELWAIVSSGQTVIKLTVDGSGNLTSSGVQITGLSKAQSIAVSPDGLVILVVDGGTAQQVKAFNTSNGSSRTSFATSGSLGVAGGYATGPAVTNTKFMFKANNGFNPGSLQGYVAYMPDGTFWLGDSGNCRNLHFSAGDAPIYIEQFACMPSFYSVRLCNNDPTRLFADWLEFSIDYSKPLSPTNGSWTLAKNWAYAMPNVDTYDVLNGVGTYSNGRTYGIVGDNAAGKRRVWELTATGSRDTGKAVYPFFSYIDNNFNIYFAESKGPGDAFKIVRNVCTGFDGSNNPTWTIDPEAPPTSVYFTATLPAKFPITGQGKFSVLPTSGGIIPIFNTDSGNLAPSLTDDHFGGLDFATGATKFQSHPAVNTNQGGLGSGNMRFLLYPEASYFPLRKGGGGNYGGCMVYKSNRPDIFTSFRGEGWGTAQNNHWLHWHESGLVVGEFGTAVTGFGQASTRYPRVVDGHVVTPSMQTAFKGLAGEAGNAFIGDIAYVNGNYYIYHGDEWHHAGVHRWQITNLDSVNISNQTVNWNSGSYVAFTDPTDMLQGLPYNQTNLTSGTAGWVRSPTTDIGNDNTEPHYMVYTNAINCNPHRQRDIVFQSSGTISSVYKNVPRVSFSDWRIDAEIDWAIQWSAYAVTVSDSISLDVLDDTGKRLLRITNLGNFDENWGTMYVNDIAIRPRIDFFAWHAYAEAKRPLTIISNVGNGTMLVTYGDFSITASAHEAGASIAHMQRIKINYPGTINQNKFGLAISKLNFTETSAPPPATYNLAPLSLSVSSPVLDLPVINASPFVEGIQARVYWAEVEATVGIEPSSRKLNMRGLSPRVWYSPPLHNVGTSGNHLVGWYRAYDNTQLTVNSDGSGGAPADGALFGRWNDMSGNNNHLVISGNSRPRYRAGRGIGFQWEPGATNVHGHLRNTSFSPTLNVQNLTVAMVFELTGTNNIPLISFGSGSNLCLHTYGADGGDNQLYRVFTDNSEYTLFNNPALSPRGRKNILAMFSTPSGNAPPMIYLQQNTIETNSMATQPADAASVNAVYIGTFPAGTAKPYRIYELMIFNESFNWNNSWGSVTQLNQYMYYWSNLIEPRQYPGDAPVESVAVLGDALSMGVGSALLKPWHDPAYISNRPTANWYCFCSDTGLITSPAIDKNTLIARVANASNENGVVVVWMGTNDIINGVSGATAHTALSNYCTTLAGHPRIKVVVATLQHFATNNTQRQAYNTLIKANYTSYADAIVKLDEAPELDNSSDTTYYNADAVNLNDAGHAAAGALFNTALNSL